MLSSQKLRDWAKATGAASSFTTLTRGKQYVVVATCAPVAVLRGRSHLRVLQIRSEQTMKEMFAGLATHGKASGLIRA